MMLLETGLAQVSGDRHRPAPRRAGGAGLAGLLATSAPPMPQALHRGHPPARDAGPDTRPAAAAAARVRDHPGRPPDRLRPHRRSRSSPRCGRTPAGCRSPTARGSARPAAKVSAVMEAVERWHAERPRIALRFGEPADLAGLGRAVDIDALPRRRAPGAGPLAWAEATDLATGAPALVPFDLVHTCWLAGLPELAVLHLDRRPRLGQPSRRGGAARALRADRGRRRDAVRAAAARGTLGPAHRRRRRSTRPRSPGSSPTLAGRGFDAGALGRDHRRRGRHGALRADRRRGAALAGGLRLGLPPRPRRRGAPGDHRGGADPGDRHRRRARRPRPRPLRPGRRRCASAAPSRASGEAATRPWAALPTAARDCLRADLRAVVAAVTAAGCGPVLAVDLSREPRLAVVRLVVPGLEPAAPPARRSPGRAPRGRRRTSHDRHRLRRPEPRRRLRRRRRRA